MTVLQGARRIATPGLNLQPRVRPYTGRRPAPTAQRRRVSAKRRAGQRAQPFGALIAIVLVALAVGLIYVAQTVRLAAVEYEIDGLAAQRDDLARQLQTMET